MNILFYDARGRIVCVRIWSQVVYIVSTNNAPLSIMPWRQNTEQTLVKFLQLNLAHIFS